MKHYQEKLSAYLHQELPKEERQMIAEHLLQCEICRKEHDQIKLGVSLASKLEAFDAPMTVWNEIKDSLDGNYQPTFSFLNQPSFFNRRGWFALGTSSLIVTGFLVTLLSVNLFYRQPLNSPIISQSNGTQNTSPANSTPNQSSPFPDSGWEVETIAGTPFKNYLGVGETLETNADSRARIMVADIGNVDVEPNSRVKLIRSEQTERRLSLEHGKLQAQIFAPPRLFIIDTPSAVAVDWGCAYTLEVDKAGNSKLHVTSGYVSLERDGRESIVPMGAMAVTKKGKGIGTPFSETASSEFKNALYKFDFANGGQKSLNYMLKNSRCHDTVTLWNLLSRVPLNERGKVFDVIVSFIKLPDGITREGILNLDQKMMEKLRWELENLWFQ